MNWKHVLVKPAWLLSALLALAASGHAQQAMDVGTRLQLFTDSALIATSSGLKFRLHSPQRQEVVFRFDAPWEGRESAYVTLFRDSDGYRMYYRGGGETTREVTCMALSPDGISWTRPKLGLYEFQGSKENNIVYVGQHKSYWESHNFTPFKDTNPAAAPEARYKALGLGRAKRPDGEDVMALLALGSPDGIHWKRLQDKAVITTGSFDSQNVAFWDAAKGHYACYYRHAREGKRSVLVTTSTDFLHWSAPLWLDFGSTPLEHFYTNAILPYFREPSFYVGFPMRFVPERKSIGLPPRTTDGLSDAVFISSRDGMHFDRTFLEAFIRPGLDPANWGNAHGNNTPVWGLAQTTATEISLYWCENYGLTPQVRRGTLRTDGFASVQAPYQGGEFVTPTLVHTGKRLVLNCSTSAVGSIRVELQDAAGKPLPGYTLEESDPIWGDELARPVSWKGRTDVGATAGKAVRMRFVMRDADLYALRFEP